ncbi:MAG: hypothetical protein GEU90_12440 [Gemmatimonas sp.]|nr:hypothetical protein [Gemmatimonas sp.]
MTRLVGFVSHPDCARHDTGWNHPDHQGRLPAIRNAVYADMVTLFEHLVEVGGRHASDEELELVHTAEYLAQVQSWSGAAAKQGGPIEVQPGLRVSEASWDAARAAVGCVLTAIDTVIDGRTTSAFCASRPPGADASPDSAAGFCLLNSVAVGARHLIERRSIRPLLVIELRGGTPSALSSLLAEDPDVRVLSFAAEAGSPLSPAFPALPPSVPSMRDALTEAYIDEPPPAFILLAAGFDIVAVDPVGHLGLLPGDVYELTAILREWADRVCAGRLVSVLEGGYAARELGEAVVRHVRALAALPCPA